MIPTVHESFDYLFGGMKNVSEPTVSRMPKVVGEARRYFRMSDCFNVY